MLAPHVPVGLQQLDLIALKDTFVLHHALVLCRRYVAGEMPASVGNDLAGRDRSSHVLGAVYYCH
jgi:hypothetical protein